MEEDDWLDVIGGSAGLALGCEQFLKLNVYDEWHDAAVTAQRSCAENLVAKTRETEAGVAWIIPSEEFPLLGFAHGWSGIVTALSCAVRRISEEDQKASLETCLREASAFTDGLLTSHGEWRDFRSGLSKTKPLNRSWCHGLPGIIRGLIETQTYWTPGVRSKFDLFLKQIIQSVGSSETYRFCCGEMGNVDFLLDYARMSEQDEGSEKYSRSLLSAKKIISSTVTMQKHLIPELAFPGLFHGRSGILYTATRFILPDLPSLSGQNLHLSRGVI